MKLWNILGWIWAFPITCLGMLYSFLFQTLGYYKFDQFTQDQLALVWIVKDDCPAWLAALWKDWGGHTIGNVIVLKQPNDTTLVHEKQHVKQCMQLGIFQPVLYVLCYAIIKIACNSSHPYYDNPFEIDARRAAGQMIDIAGQK